MIRERMERSHTIMAKWIKKLLGLAAIGSAAAGLVYYFKKSKKDEGEDFNDDFEFLWLALFSQSFVRYSIGNLWFPG